jgi:threonine/homoserine/homoserine lactone efflux protein
MAGGTVAAFWAVSFLLVVTPGADWGYAIAAGLGHRTVLPAVGGLLTGHLAATVVVAAWVAALAPARCWCWQRCGAGQASGSWVRQAAKSVGISGLNPKVLLLFVAMLPQFIRHGWRRRGR